MIIDLRSDTVTRPTPAMMQAMMQASVGDDVFGEDPTVNALEEKCASLLGMEAAVFCPSGTMTNQIGIKVLTQPYEEVICYRGAHIYKYEGGGLAGNSLVSVRLLAGDRGRLSVDEMAAQVNADDQHYPRTSVIALENTVVREAGSYYTLRDIAPISAFARSKKLLLHLDGARLFNALAVTGDHARDYGKYFDTISICLSKGLGAPVGSVLACKKEFAKKARRMRKAWGGAWRQAGFLAAAGLYALEHHVARLTEDHQRAKKLADCLRQQPYVASVMPTDTNIVIFELIPSVTPAAFLEKINAHGIKALVFSATEIRLVTHLDFDDAMLQKTVDVFSTLRF
ncbi:MAG: aminotransferase class I/II-fold pyridoxal phosphate-dependent enzyme [Cyclobacteriaceae bacterium]|jgi:threonine aldolase|nr:aminotransferase class I/II-fold pyridoxal phosphate-dependent enzyme [Cyclobacteriaceae bacterium]